MTLVARIDARLPLLTRILWGAALFTTPVTSFRFFPILGPTTLVRPLSFYPIALLIPLLMIQWVRKKVRFPSVSALVPLSAFILVVFAGSMFGSVLDPLPLRGQEYFGRVLRAWATLIIGLTYFICAIAMNQSEEDLRFTVKWLLGGFMIDILWSGVQAFAFYTPVLDKVTVTHWQLVFSMRELVKTNRVSGMAYEPAWLAGQMVTLYLPWLFALIWTGYRVAKYRWIEFMTFGLALLLMLATYSRGGLLNLMISAILTILLLGRFELRKLWSWFLSGYKNFEGMLIRFAIALGVIGALIGAGWYLAQKEYITRIFQSDAESVEDFIIENSAGARAAYISGALGAYDESPWLGVGLGASGFYIYDNLPDWALTTVPEIARQLSPESNLYPNPKNIYVRLLAETGIFGFFLFIAFQFSLLGDVFAALKVSHIGRFLAVAGFFAWTGIMIYNFTQDSFTTPNIWINLGVISGMVASDQQKRR